MVDHTESKRRLVHIGKLIGIRGEIKDLGLVRAPPVKGEGRVTKGCTDRIPRVVEIRKLSI